jgi:hypothetical protein
MLFFTMLQNTYAQEIKIGIMQHDFNTKLAHRYEKGQNITVEYLFDKMPNYIVHTEKRLEGIQVLEFEVILCYNY